LDLDLVPDGEPLPLAPEQARAQVAVERALVGGHGGGAADDLGHGPGEEGHGVDYTGARGRPSALRGDESSTWGELPHAAIYSRRSRGAGGAGERPGRRMLTYADVIAGRLLLHEGAVTPQGMWAALREVAASGQTIGL